MQRISTRPHNHSFTHDWQPDKDAQITLSQDKVARCVTRNSYDLQSWKNSNNDCIFRIVLSRSSCAMRFTERKVLRYCSKSISIQQLFGKLVWIHLCYNLKEFGDKTRKLHMFATNRWKILFLLYPWLSSAFGFSLFLYTVQWFILQWALLCSESWHLHTGQLIGFWTQVCIAPAPAAEYYTISARVARLAHLEPNFRNWAWNNTNWPQTCRFALFQDKFGPLQKSDLTTLGPFWETIFFHFFG